MAAVAEPIVVAKPHDSTAARILRFIAKAPVHLVLAALGLLWLVPTFGLFITSIYFTWIFDDKFEYRSSRSRAD